MLPTIDDTTVVRLRAPRATNEYGDVVLDWSGRLDRLRVEGCSFQPMAGDEFNQGREAVTTRWQWLGPPDADVRSDDRIEHDGVAYEVDGSVQRPRGLGLDHTSAICKRTEG